jgi:hypothetical protein
MPMRTAKSCGPDAPTLVSSRRATADDGGKQARSPGRARRKPVKAIARGMPGVSGVLVVTNARAYYHTTRGCGCSGARHSLRPLITEGKEIDSKTRAYQAARSRSCVCERRCLKNLNLQQFIAHASASSPAVIARLDRAPSIPETPAIESRSRSVRDTPAFAGYDGLGCV